MVSILIALSLCVFVAVEQINTILYETLPKFFSLLQNKYNPEKFPQRSSGLKIIINLPDKFAYALVNIFVPGLLFMRTFHVIGFFSSFYFLE